MQNMASSWDDLGQPSAWGCWFPIEEVPSDGRRGQNLPYILRISCVQFASQS